MNAVRLGIVGLGRGFMLMLPALRADRRVVLAGAFDLRSEARTLFAREFSAQAYDSLEGMLQTPDLDAVYVATPHALHAEQAIAALNAGKHVLVEKPMALSVSDCAAMAEAAAKAGKALIVGPSHGFDAPVQKAAELVASGRLGAIKQVTALNFTDFMYRPRRPDELDSRNGGGVVFSQAVHQIDVVRRLVGRPIVSVRATTGNWDGRRKSDGAYNALLTFEGGVPASLVYSGYSHYDSDELVGWVSELGSVKDPESYGTARRALANLSADDEARAKMARTYGAGGGQTDASAPPHHEHFGFVLASCERADIKLSPTGLTVYGDERREFLPIEAPRLPRAAVVDELVGAVQGTRAPVHDANWGLDTMICCAAMTESSGLGIDISTKAIDRSHRRPLAL